VSFELIWVSGKQEYLSRPVWTTQITLNWLAKFVFRRNGFAAFQSPFRAISKPKPLLIFPQGGHQG
jgi:hypothetical protein